MSNHLNQPLRPTLTGYTLTEKLYAGGCTAVYRALADAETQTRPVVIKFLRGSSTGLWPSPQARFKALVRFRNQYIIAKNLPSERIVRPLTLEPWGHSYALVMEDLGGVALSEYVQRCGQLSVGEVLAIALQMADILYHLSQHRVLHKDIKPANILIHPDTHQIWLTDFSLASLLPKESQQLQHPGALEGTLAYMAPEQTGRMNRGIDYRADFYGLGVTLYELLTGALPFQDDDPMALIHSHIAKVPIPPCEFSPLPHPVIPTSLSDIVLKLMAKNAEDRYQSALGIKSDFQQCLHQWNETGSIVEFVLGQRDLSDRFFISEKLYGREAEVQTLIDAFERVAQGNSELMLIAGFSGIGKTVVVNEVQKPVTERQGYFIKGKFDQFNRNIPFSAFVQAFQDLVKQLLSERDVALHRWKVQILESLEDSAQVMVNLVPELENIIGEQPPAPELLGSAAQNRFNLLFQKFIQVFTTAEHPLVMFLDDLQWADSASLKLVQGLMGDTQMGHLLLLGAYRDNEVFPAHPLMLTLGAIEKTKSGVHTIALPPLNTGSLNHLIADTLHTSPSRTQPLTDLVMQKTQGNPFFFTQFLNALHQDELITFDTAAGHWQCDIIAVQDAAMTDDVVELMAQRLRKLPADTQTILQLAACIGAQFDLETLAIVSQKSAADVAFTLWKALQEGLVLPISEVYKFFQGTELAQDNSAANPSYRFFHDRVQQAAYALIAEENKKTKHLQIGKLMLKEASLERREENLFQIVNQLNAGFTLIQDPQQRYELAELNLQAGQKARLSTAYAAASEYFELAIAQLGEHPWEQHYTLTKTLYESLAEADYLNGDYAAAEAHIQHCLQQTQQLAEQYFVYNTLILLRISQSRMLEGIEIATELIQRLGIDMVSSLSEAYSAQNMTAQTLMSMPEMTDEAQLFAMQLMMTLLSPAFNSKPDLCPKIANTIVELSHRHGLSKYSAFGYSLLSVFSGDFSIAEKVFVLLDRFEDATIRGRSLLLLNAHVYPWIQHLNTTFEPLSAVIKVGLDVGDLEYAAYGAMHSCGYRFLSGEYLPTISDFHRDCSEMLLGINQLFQIEYNNIFAQLILNLQGDADDPKRLSGRVFEKEKQLPHWIEQKNHQSIYVTCLADIMLSYLFEEVVVAAQVATFAQAYEDGVAGLIHLVTCKFYSALAWLAHLPSDTDEQQRQQLEKINRYQAEIKAWAVRAPMNFEHQYLLIEAEKLHYLGRPWQALEHYDAAIAGAKANGYRQDEAISNELAAKFCLGQGKANLAAVYMQEAYYCYSRWGADAKTDYLEQHYPQLLQTLLHQSAPASYSLDALSSVAPLKISVHSSSSVSQTSAKYINQALDLSTILKAAQALSESIDLNELLEKLAQMMMQTSGAERLALILPNAGEAWQVRVMATPESIQLTSTMLGSHTDLPIQLIQYVQRTQEILVVDGLEADLPIVDAYLQQYQPRSALCLPLLHQNQLKGLLYLQHQSVAAVFHRDRITILNFLCTQAAISLENAQLYHTLEQRVATRTQALQASQHELTDYIENAATSLHWVDASGIITWANQTELDFLGYRREEYIGQPIANFHADEAVIGDLLRRLSNRETIVNHEARLRCKDGSIRYVQISSNVFYRDGEFIHTRCFTTDITERKSAEMALNDLVVGTAATIGEDFFPALVRHISVALEVPIALVTQFVDQELQSLAFVVDGEFQPNFTYNLPDTPCRDLVVEYTYYCPSDLSKYFPNHPHRAREVDSYLGVALRDRQGQVLGSLCIFDRQPFQDLKRARQILNIFGGRAAAELERQRTEKALENLIAGTAVTTRADFFPVLVRYLAEALGVSHALMAERGVDEEVALAYFGDGKRLPLQAFSFLNTPCEEVYEHGAYYCELEPCQTTCTELNKMEARSYLGVALKDRQGNAIGILAIFHRQILPDPVHAEQILRVFAARAATELERQRAEQAMEQLNRELEVRVRDRTAQLAASENRLRTLFNQTADAVFLLGDDEFIDCNQAAVDLLRYPNKTELLARQPHQISPEKQPDGQLSSIKTQLMMEEAFQRCSCRFEWVHQRADGDNFWAEITLTPIRYQEEIIFHGIVRDISDRKQLEEEQARLTAVLEATPDFIGIANAQGELLWHNKPLRELRQDLSNLEAHRLLENCHPDWVNKIIRDEALPTAIAQGSWSGELALLDGDGNEIPVSQVIIAHKSKSGTVENFSTVMRDIRDRKQADANSRLLASVVESSDDAIITKNLNGIITSWNQAAVKLFGYTETEVLGQSIEILFPEDRIQEEPKIIARLQNKEPVEHFETVRLHKDGTRIDISVTISPLTDKSGDVVGASKIVRDIRDRKHYEQQLQTLSNKLELAIESAQIGIWDWNDENNHLSWDKRMFEIYGVRPEEFKECYQDWENRIHPEDLAQYEAGKRIRNKNNENEYTQEFRIVRPDNTIRYIFSTAFIERDAQGKPMRMVGTNLDITDRKMAELSLQQSEEKFRTLVSNLHGAVYRSQNDAAWTMNYVSDAISALSGYPASDFIENNVRTFVSIIHPEDVDYVNESVTQAIAKQESFLLEYRILHQDGSIRWVYEKGKGIFDPDNQFQHLEGVIFDISDRKQAEAELKRTNEELVRATRMKDEFLANMSHELRTPLNAILGMTEGLQDEVFGEINEQQLKSLTTIEQSGSHLLELINEILDLAKIESGSIELEYSRVSVTHLCQSSLTFIRQQSLEKGIQLYLNIPWDLPNIQVDERRFRQVLINLLNNAVKFTPSGGSVTLKVALLPPDETHNRQALSFVVSDTGIGIAPDQLSRLFQPFIQIDSALNRQYEGTGLGLALVKRIVELHGGRVNVTSTVGVGSCFTVELPYKTATLQALIT